MSISRILIIFCFLSLQGIAQEEKPKLVVGIVVDQMRYDYLERFWGDFGNDGFKRLVNDGFNCKNVNYSYKPTYTGPGHASIFTGTTPSQHGIVGNNWYSREKGETVYCVSHKDEDGSYTFSPNKLFAESIADKIRQGSNMEGKSFGISLKDRGAILPAGQLANGAYWFDDQKGEWVSSDYYEYSSPLWLKEFNEIDFFDSYLKNNWNLSLSADNYSESSADQNEFERPFVKGGSVVFPYNLKSIYEEKGWSLLKAVPSGNQMTVDLASTIIKEEKLGIDDQLDFLSISFSTTDYIGHQFGAQSVEVHDTYIKLDKSLAKFLMFLDQVIGEKNYLLFLTSDHGAAMPRKYLESISEPCGYIDSKELKNGLDSLLDATYGVEEWISSLINYNVYYNDSLVNQLSHDQFRSIKEASIKWLEQQEGIKYAVDRDCLQYATEELLEMTKRGVNVLSSGDIVMIEELNWNSYPSIGSTHGSPYLYDTHVPLIFYGNGILAGETDKRYSITAIAPTLSKLLGINPPDQSNGQIIKEVLTEERKGR